MRIKPLGKDQNAMPLEHIFDTTGPIAGRLGDTTKDEAVRLAIALCFAADQAAEHGHGNICPGAVHIGPEETVVLDPMHSNAPSVEETEYAAPERFWNGTVSPAGDVYSIGLILYAALNKGRLPFIPTEGRVTADHRAAALKYRMNGDKITFPDSFDDSLCEILQRALAFRAEDRWETPMALCDALSGCAADAAAGVLPAESGAVLFGKDESDMTEVERMMSEILDQNAAADAEAAEPEAENAEPDPADEEEDAVIVDADPISDDPAEPEEEADLPLAGISAAALAMGAAVLTEDTDAPSALSPEEIAPEVEEPAPEPEVEEPVSEPEAEDHTPEDAAALAGLAALAESGAGLPLDEMFSKVDSHLDALSSSLFQSPDPLAEEKEAERRRRIAEATEAYEQEKRAKTRKRRLSIAAIIGMILAALAALLLLAHSFGFKGFSLNDIGNAISEIVSDIFSGGDDNPDQSGEDNDNQDDPDVVPPPVSPDDEQNNPDDTTENNDDPDAETDPDHTVNEDDNPSNNPDTGNDNAVTPGNPNNPSNPSNPDNPSNPSNPSNPDNPPAPGGGTSGPGTPVPDSKPEEPTSTYTLTVDNCIWRDARDAAEDAGGHLATVNSEEEFLHLIALAEEQGVSYIWLGGYRKSGSWLWITGEEFTYAPWHNGKPSGADAHYVVLCRVVENGTVTWGYCNYKPDAKFPEGKLAYFTEFE